jgi:hypothetical protein
MLQSKWSRAPLHPLLLPAYAVLGLYAHNIQLVRLAELWEPLFWAIAGGALLLAAAAIVMRDIERGALLASALALAYFGYGHVVELLGEERDVAPALLVGGWLLLIGGVALFSRRSRRVGDVNRGLNVATGVLLAFALATIVPFNLHPPAQAGNSAAQPSGLIAPRKTQRDIWYFVFDRYGSASALKAGFSVTDNDLPAWLADRGFQVAPHAHANYVRTTLSLASVLNLDYLDQVVARQGPDSGDYGPLNEMLQQHLVGRFLREQGYRYVHLGAWFNPTRTIAIADENLEHDTTTEFEAVMYDTTAMPLIASLVAPPEAMPPHDQKHVDAARFQFRMLPRIMREAGPKLVTAHILLPHDPFVFDEHGNYVSDDEQKSTTVEERFRAQLEYTNSRIKEIVGQLLAVPADRQPIIIIQADEGPYPARYKADQQAFDWSTATSAELETKYGILDTFYLPPDDGVPADAPEPYPTMSSVNTFRLVLDRYFGLDLPFLPDRSFTSRSPDRPYDLAEITDRLPSP